MSNYNFSPTLDGLNNVESNNVNSDTIITDYLTVNNSSSVPTLPNSTNNNEIASTAFVQNLLSSGTSNLVTTNTTQTITGEKTFTNANTYITGNLITNSIQADAPTNNINIGTQLTTGDINLGTVASTGQNVALNWGTTSNSGQLTFRGGSFNLLATGDYTQRTSTNGTTNIDTTKTTGTFNMLTGSTWSGTANIGSNATATGTFNIGASGTTTFINGNTTINKIKGQYIDLFAGQLRMFSGSAGGDAIYFYVPPSGRSIMDFSTTNCDMVGQYNLTSNNITCSIAPTSSNEYTNKNYVDSAISGGLSGYMNLTTAQTASGDKTFNGITTFDNNVINNFFVNNLDVVSFQNGAYFDNVCPYSTVPASGSQDLVTKGFTETATQTITGAKTFNNFAVNQTSGDVNITLNSSTQKVNIVRGTNTINFSTNAGPALNSSSTTAPFVISAGSGATSAGFNLNPSGGLGEGPEMIIGSTAYCGKNLWVDGTNGGFKSFGTNNMRIYNPFAYSYNPSTITWCTPSPNTINGWSNASSISTINDGQTYTGTASDNSTPANVGQIVLPAPGIWFLQVSALITLNTGSDTITDRTIVVSDVGTTDNTPCTVGFAYRDPIDDGAGSAGNRQIVNFSGIYHFVDVSSGTRTLYINAIVITSGTRTVTVSGNYKYTRIG